MAKLSITGLTEISSVVQPDYHTKDRLVNPLNILKSHIHTYQIYPYQFAYPPYLEIFLYYHNGNVSTYSSNNALNISKIFQNPVLHQYLLLIISLTCIIYSR